MEAEISVESHCCHESVRWQPGKGGSTWNERGAAQPGPQKGSWEQSWGNSGVLRGRVRLAPRAALLLEWLHHPSLSPQPPLCWATCTCPRVSYKPRERLFTAPFLEPGQPSWKGEGGVEPPSPPFLPVLLLPLAPFSAFPHCPAIRSQA